MQGRAQDELALAKRGVAVVPLDFAAGNLDDAASARDPHDLCHVADLVPVGARVHPERAAARAGDAAQALDAGEAATACVNAQARQAVARAHRDALAVEEGCAL